jgi:hypothetical protein
MPLDLREQAEQRDDNLGSKILLAFQADRFLDGNQAAPLLSN